jgi:hypothetical protein
MSGTKSLSTAQRAAVASRLGRMLELVRELRAADLDADALDALERAVRDVAVATEAAVPDADPGTAQAALASLLVTALELSPRRLRGYGELADGDARYLEHESRRLERLVGDLIDAAGRRDR